LTLRFDDADTNTASCKAIMDGKEITEHPTTLKRVVMGVLRTGPFPTYDAEEDIRRALDAGASGYRLKDSSQDDLIMPRSRTGDNASTSATLVNVWAATRPALLKSSTAASGMDHFVTRADWHRWG